MRASWIISLAGLLLLGACSMAARDQWMHFFFEIPDESASSTLMDSKNSSNEPTGVTDKALVGQADLYRHPAIRTQNCTKCHQSQTSVQVDQDAMMASCKTCHARFFSDEVKHSPVTDGDCLLCHTMHRSEFVGLLHRPAITLCLDCHDAIEDLSQPAHAVQDVENCVQCHDPHFGVNHLLKPGLEKTEDIP